VCDREGYSPHDQVSGCLGAQRADDSFHLFEVGSFMVCSHWAYVCTVRSRGFPAPVTMAARAQVSGGNGFNTARSSG